MAKFSVQLASSTPPIEVEHEAESVDAFLTAVLKKGFFVFRETGIPAHNIAMVAISKEPVKGLRRAVRQGSSPGTETVYISN